MGCHLAPVLEFLSYLNEQGIATTLRQVIIPTVNDTVDNIMNLKAIADANDCVDKIELLPFKKICQIKYDELKIDFPFSHIEQAKSEDVAKLKQLIPNYC